MDAPPPDEPSLPPSVLFIVPTPIGHWEDITIRALRVLRRADAIAAENPHVTRRMLDHYRIPTELCLYRGLAQQADHIVARISAGQTIALVCDSGTPVIADPGLRLIRAALIAGHRVSALPGAVAAVVGLVASGLSSGRFAFDGFPPRTQADRAAFFASLQREKRTVILYECGRYLRSTLSGLSSFLGPEREVAVASDLTTLREAVWRGTLREAQHFAHCMCKSRQYTLIIAGCT